MYGFSKILLEFTIERAAELMRPDPRACECVGLIRHYIQRTVVEWPTGNYSKQLADAVNWLAVMALQYREPLIASRLRQIAAQLQALNEEDAVVPQRRLLTDPRLPYFNEQRSNSKES